MIQHDRGDCRYRDVCGTYSTMSGNTAIIAAVSIVILTLCLPSLMDNGVRIGQYREFVQKVARTIDTGD